MPAIRGRTSPRIRLLEMGAQHFGFTFARSLEAATGGSVTISMLLYSGFAAPLIEEFIFRGAVLKTLEPFGKWFALLASSLAFALMHGNFAQIPFAMSAGLILGNMQKETVPDRVFHSDISKDQSGSHCKRNLCKISVRRFFRYILI